MALVVIENVLLTLSGKADKYKESGVSSLKENLGFRAAHFRSAPFQIPNI